MKKFTSLLLMLCSTLAFAVDQQSQLRLYVFEGNTPVTNYFVWMDKGTKYTANQDGASLFNMAAGKHQFSVSRSGYENVNLNLDVAEGEYLQVIVTQQKGNPVSHIALETSKEEKQGPQFSDEKKQVGEPGTIKGRLLSSEDNKPVANARIYFTGVAQEFVSDKDGYFTATVGASDYSISIIHPRFATQTVDDISVVAKQTTEKQFDLSPAGIALKEFVVIAPFIQGSVASLTDERKESSVMADFVGTEQMARSGDSDAASAITRVSGLTLIDGKYAVMRGMEDRYSTVLMNGSQVPSTDPTKMAVPLDLFPASVLDSIEVQKTYSADLPGAFGGGAVKLRSKRMPEDNSFSIKLSTGGNTAVTGKEVVDHEGSATDFLGMDDGSRAIPSGVPEQAFNPVNDFLGMDDEQIEKIGESFKTSFATTKSTAQPDMGMQVNLAKLIELDDSKLGISAYGNYKNTWSYKDIEKNTYLDTELEGISIRNQLDEDQTKFNVNLDGMLSVNWEYKNTNISWFNMLSRKSYRMTDHVYGYTAESGINISEYKLEWSERQMLISQLTGEHQHAENFKTEWRFGISQASVDTPDRRLYRYDDRSGTEAQPFGLSDGDTDREFMVLNDNLMDGGINSSYQFSERGGIKLTLKGGLDYATSERDSQLTRYDYRWYRLNNIPEDIRLNLNPDDIYTDENINSTGFIVSNRTNPADGYTADSTMLAYYLIADTTLGDVANLVVGARNESFEQNVHTFDFLSADDPEPIDVNMNTTDMLPSAMLTYKLLDNIQIRMALAKTVNRPTFMELSSSNYLEPDSGEFVRGNPQLKSAEIEHQDIRLEIYGNGANSISFAYFTKDFTNPIERTLEASAGSDDVVTFDNAPEAHNSGYEFDFRYDLPFSVFAGDIGLSGNYTKIKSEVKLPETTVEYTKTRVMQGQSPYTMNAMLTYDHEVYGLKAALIYNGIGERIVRVGKDKVPHVFEEASSNLDMTLSKTVAEDYTIGMKLRNLLNDEVEYTQGGKTYLKYKEGISYSFEISAKF